MSFILDALKKSQSSRREQQGPVTIAVEEARSAPQPHNWWALVISIVVLNLVVLLGFIYWTSRDTARPQGPAGGPAGAAGVSTAPNRIAGEQAARPASAAQESALPGRGEVRPLSTEVRRPRPPVEETTVAALPGSQADAGAVSRPAPVIQPAPAADPAFLPTLAELQLENRIALSPLHVDVHVYNENPQRRFVLINSRKYKEGERLSEGPLLETIRRDGLVMYYRGQRFLLPRE